MLKITVYPKPYGYIAVYSIYLKCFIYFRSIVTSNLVSPVNPKLLSAAPFFTRCHHSGYPTYLIWQGFFLFCFFKHHKLFLDTTPKGFGHAYLFLCVYLNSSFNASFYNYNYTFRLGTPLWLCKSLSIFITENFQPSPLLYETGQISA